MDLKKGTQIYKYELIQKLGSGNFSNVWLAHDASIDSEIALKILNPSFKSIAYLLEEARIGNKLNHSNLLKILYADVVEHNGSHLTLIAQEYHPNGSIISKLNSGNFLELPIAIRIFTDILRGLEHLHSQGFFHNDIKPSNILIGAKGEAVLADYGITGVSNQNGKSIPKDAYKIHRAPETSQNNYINITTDIYQVGITFFRLINGIGTVRDEFIKHGEKKFEEFKQKGKIPNPKEYQPYVPKRIKKIINTSVRPDPSKRYTSALEMRRDLEKCYFPGYWSTNSKGTLIGLGSKYRYRYDIIPKKNSLFDFIPYKQNIQSGRETRIVPKIAKSLSSKNINRKKTDFINWVINNAD